MKTTSFNHIANLAEVLQHNGIKRVVISPGSRNAPLIIAFDSHPNIETYIVHDERSAAFFALGMADELQEGVAVVCTSGSALLNYSPAVAEAYYRQVPLLLLTADRPEYLVDQGDGQCIRQNDVYHNFIKRFCLIEEGNALEQIKIGIQALLSNPKGPVHLNIPLEEPLYGISEFDNKKKCVVDLIKENTWSESEKSDIEKIWKSTDKKLIIVGQLIPNKRLQILFDAIAENSSVAVLVENTSNIRRFTKFCHAIDRTLAVIKEDEIEDFKPDLLISIGGAVISKKIKHFFRQNKPKHNWRIGVFEIDEDTYQSKTKSITVSPEMFFEFVNGLESLSDSNFGNKWKSKDFNAYAAHDDFIYTAPFSDLKAFDFIIDTLPESVSLQMANSSVVRYCQLFEPIDSVNYYANRGVSGIDGSTSTALGMAVVNPNKLVVLITGDISFFYDSNALWNSYLPSKI
jgi:2-succinyl-5-enolpyruvyl-6-hydroxy-3-cyclohexene-1-carboxylate synthase